MLAFRPSRFMTSCMCKASRQYVRKGLSQRGGLYKYHLVVGGAISVDPHLNSWEDPEEVFACNQGDDE